MQSCSIFYPKVIFRVQVEDKKPARVRLSNVQVFSEVFYNSNQKDFSL